MNLPFSLFSTFYVSLVSRTIILDTSEATSHHDIHNIGHDHLWLFIRSFYPASIWNSVFSVGCDSKLKSAFDLSISSSSSSQFSLTSDVASSVPRL